MLLHFVRCGSGLAKNIFQEGACKSEESLPECFYSNRSSHSGENTKTFNLSFKHIRPATHHLLLWTYECPWAAVIIYPLVPQDSYGVQQVTYVVIRTALVVSWGWAALLTCAPVLGLGLYYSPEAAKLGDCPRYRTAIATPDVAYAAFYVFFGTLLCVVLVYCNLAVIRALYEISAPRAGNAPVLRRLSRSSCRQRTPRAAPAPAPPVYNAATAEEVAFSRLMATLSVLFMICWLPQMSSSTGFVNRPCRPRPRGGRFQKIIILERSGAASIVKSVALESNVPESTLTTGELTHVFLTCRTKPHILCSESMLTYRTGSLSPQRDDGCWRRDLRRARENGQVSHQRKDSHRRSWIQRYNHTKRHIPEKSPVPCPPLRGNKICNGREIGLMEISCRVPSAIVTTGERLKIRLPSVRTHRQRGCAPTRGLRAARCVTPEPSLRTRDIGGPKSGRKHWTKSGNSENSTRSWAGKVTSTVFWRRCRREVRINVYRKRAHTHKGVTSGGGIAGASRYDSVILCSPEFPVDFIAKARQKIFHIKKILPHKKDDKLFIRMIRIICSLLNNAQGPLCVQVTSALFLARGPAGWPALQSLGRAADVLMLLNYVLDPVLYVLLRRRRPVFALLCNPLRCCRRQVLPHPQ
ncbi:hypothetical protein EVAR_46659_1 [Eumeta japonica]|uniref:G-protein coupled receptors family 1 profile domain-containing protein n=1 Tax=Eumeta variegata TaxID=151549 RepID=A0A4C1Y599_EUMVA|nr:hypothetical protein EVAR_46659_1 [Eumeta japonica]